MSDHAPLPPLSLATAYFGSALFFLAWAAAGLIWIAPELATGAFPLRAAVAVTHLFTLGWITLSILGALHHFVAVTLHTRLMPVPCAFLQLAAFTVGLTVFAAAGFANRPEIALAGAALLALALLGFAVRLAVAMLRVRPRGRTARALLAAGGFLMATATFGVALAGDPWFGWLGSGRSPLLGLHVHLGLVGWVLLVLVAVAQRLLPMFLLSRAPSARLGSLSLALIAAGALALLAFHTAAPVLRIWLPLLLVGSGVAVFLLQVVRIFMQRSAGELDPGMRLAGVGLVFLGIAVALAPFALRFGFADPQRLVLYLSSAILAAAALFVCGHYYRIVPFLVWSHRFAQSGARADARGPAALYRNDLAALSLLCFVTGAVTLLVAIGHGAPRGAQGGAVAFAVGVALLAVQIFGVLQRRPVG